MGLPSIVIPLAENQLQICQNLVNEEAVISLSLDKIPGLLNAKVDELCNNFETLREKNLNLCDGKGCVRVVEMMRHLGWY